ncbi:aldehyde dehydrogenase (NAD+) [Cnuella takakiae]|uniref:Aldehyde dehydrogenase n=1 Tax=Cnuella takakiae TaxID=1302690 RepID=A0A1M5ESL5_9BACT|nr:aldehyde dehydrogenase [Cnuella takakiae]OLY91289.1 aldehyde dehydrogenase family protein [Cnuella takakiae]SHF82293.1 aldehyde dehydrogenase (NAD+) [Cnuella takakiae]
MNDSLLHALRQNFQQGNSRSYAWRRQQLLNLKAALYRHEEAIYAALSADLKKSKEEAWITEIGFVLSEISYVLRHLKSWMQPQNVGTNLLNFPSKSYLLSEPLGVVLIIGPWNYPLQLVLAPLVGALAAGNCAVVKPSELAPATSAVLRQITASAFKENEVLLVEGEGAAVIPRMMEAFRFDHVFYTGSTQVGTIIYQLAAKQLVPVTLELGGKSPTVIEPDANLEVAARRIAVTKFSNAGQMCVAPDYLLVHQSVREPFVQHLKKAIDDFYVSEAVRDYHYGKVVNQRQFDRLLQYLQEGTVLYGGSYDAPTLHLSPTLLADVRPEAKVMQEEIFGPLLPVLTWSKEQEALDIIARNNNPLAFYVFTENDKKANWWMEQVPAGGGCINNVSFHLTNHNLPFGGRGNSGMGAYHGKYSFDTFSHKKGVLKTPTWFDPAFKYPPFKGKLNILKRFMR